MGNYGKLSEESALLIASQEIRKNLNKNLVEEIFQDVVHRLLNRFLRISNRKVIKSKIRTIEMLL